MLVLNPALLSQLFKVHAKEIFTLLNIVLVLF